jgi:hypothetical protein
MNRVVKCKPAHIVFSIILAVYLSCLLPEATAITVEAENATIKTAGEPINGGWGLYSNGTVGEYVCVQKTGTYTVVVRAYGSSLGGIWPLMALSVDGLARLTQGLSVNSREFKDYSFQVEFTPGVHSVGVAFLNDASNGRLEDRNLYLDKIEIRPALGFEELVLAREEEWASEAKAREDAVLQGINEAIKKNRGHHRTETARFSFRRKYLHV